MEHQLPPADKPTLDLTECVPATAYCAAKGISPPTHHDIRKEPKVANTFPLRMSPGLRAMVEVVRKPYIVSKPVLDYHPDGMRLAVYEKQDASPLLKAAPRNHSVQSVNECVLDLIHIGLVEVEEDVDASIARAERSMAAYQQAVMFLMQNPDASNVCVKDFEEDTPAHQLVKELSLEVSSDDQTPISRVDMFEGLTQVSRDLQDLTHTKNALRFLVVVDIDEIFQEDEAQRAATGED